jgi:hypothetical protein
VAHLLRGDYKRSEYGRVRAVAHVDDTLEVDGALAGPIGVSRGETAPSYGLSTVFLWTRR